MARQVGRHRASRNRWAGLRRPVATSLTALGLVCGSAAVYQYTIAGHANAPTVQAAVQLSPGRHAMAVAPVHLPTSSRSAVPAAVRPRATATQLSRSQTRPSSPPTPAPARATASTAVTAGRPLSPAQAQAMARSMLAAYGWGQAQWPCLDKLWTQESSWMTTAENPSSGAYGIPQSLPASKMATIGADYRTDTRTQLTWGMQYVRDAYGSPCSAWSFHLAHNWY